MSQIQIGNGFIDFKNEKSLIDLLNFLKENRDKAKELGVNSILDTAIVAEYNGKLTDLSEEIGAGGRLTFHNANSNEGLDALHHSASHIMAQAVLRLFPGSKFGVGPAIKDGFYYDIDISTPINESDIPKIEAEMEKIIEAGYTFTREEVSKNDAVDIFTKIGQTYKVELLKDIPSDRVSIYKQGEFSDLCRGPHIPSTKYLKAFKLLNISGAYWRGSEKNAMLTRIYGTAFADKKALKDHLNMLEEAKKRDHRKLGKELDLFSIDDQIGGGLVLWHPKGARIRYELEQFWREEHYRNGYELVFTPHIGRSNLWKQAATSASIMRICIHPWILRDSPFMSNR